MCKNNIKNKTKNENMMSWYKCWKANLGYYKYSNDIFNQIIESENENTDTYQRKMYKIYYVFKFVICIAIASCDDKKPDVKKEVIANIYECLIRIQENKKCLNTTKSNLRNELQQILIDERGKKVIMNNFSDDLRKRLLAAGLHTPHNTQKAIDLGEQF
tara:strand:- start:888 stop:1364 length:477 start_codon:yes stop_codon:yes gene_type:complete